MEITKALCLSTVHIKPETADRLNTSPDSFSMTIWASEYGWFMPIHPVEDGSGNVLPQDLADCMVAAQEQGCEFLRLDQDGPVEEGLESYDW